MLKVAGGDDIMFSTTNGGVVIRKARQALKTPISSETRVLFWRNFLER
jgi:hypothetical protein